ncbi:RagB/SusD family nutrient uptake outer membrane protein [Pontibacter sp. SGAir0037]|uniref:RagB/SusD family nutrient uptake outer membrane protein n=1 Tax=Pontibacter sp. SGAir0037 TaxID=2571030 RepID=UPI0010CD619F|nr:RagB/SusD family nutrient uptake outer membrane protein [Pontibacter sp. SGAir0037]QCR23505.1 RagB/SusD family nutrient uptake outer membrane protein [Pontibacter sp. SGAir0037]
MKNKFVILSGLLALSLFTGCGKEFLDRPPQDTLVDAIFFSTDDQLLAASAPLYSVVWKDYADKASWALGDLRGGTTFRAWGYRDDVLFNTTAVSSSNNEAYRAFYIVIGQANTLIQNINTYAGAGVSEAVKNHALAEARFMRATAYYYLVSNYGPVPIIENNIALLNDKDLTRNTVESVWEFITRDYLFAAANLPSKPVQPGRISKWSAEGMLARTYLTRAGVGSSGKTRNQEYLDKAKEYAQRVIESNVYALLPNYENLFRYPYDNNSESLFELQWVFTTDYGYANTMVSQLTFSNDIANGDGWGGDLGASWWMLSLYDGLIDKGNLSTEDDDGVRPGFTVDQRLKATYMLPGFQYPEISQTVRNDAGVESEQRLVFPAPGNDADQSFASIKKYVVGKAKDVGGQAIAQRYPNNTYMLRLSEMYLTYAEAALGNNASTNDAKALEYFNVVHMRAGLPEYEDALTWDVIFHERIKEFAMEGLAWYDLVRLHYYDPDKAYKIINEQDRGLFVIKPDRMPNPTGWTFTKTSWFEGRKANANSGNFLLPIPAAEASQAPNLRKEPVPYDFGG